MNLFKSKKKSSDRWLEIAKEEFAKLHGNPKAFLEMQDITDRLEEAGCKGDAMNVIRFAAELIAEGKLSAQYYVVSSDQNVRERITPFFNSITEMPRVIADYKNNVEQELDIQDIKCVYCLPNADLNSPA